MVPGKLVTGNFPVTRGPFFQDSVALHNWDFQVAKRMIGKKLDFIIIVFSTSFSLEVSNFAHQFLPKNNLPKKKKVNNVRFLNYRLSIEFSQFEAPKFKFVKIINPSSRTKVGRKGN